MFGAPHLDVSVGADHQIPPVGSHQALGSLVERDVGHHGRIDRARQHAVLVPEIHRLVAVLPWPVRDERLALEHPVLRAVLLHMQRLGGLEIKAKFRLAHPLPRLPVVLRRGGAVNRKYPEGLPKSPASMEGLLDTGNNTAEQAVLEQR